MKHWGESFSQGVRLLRVVDHDGREQILSIQTGDTTGWTAIRLDADGATADVTLRRRELRIGRDRGVDLVLNDPHLAGQHCRIFERDGHLVLVDRGSPLGTYVNGRRCTEPTTLSDGDRIELGRSLIEVMPGRSQLDIRKIGAQIRHHSTSWLSSDEELRAAFYRELQRHAQLWRERGRPNTRLLERKRLARAIGLAPWIAFDAEVKELISASIKKVRRQQGISWTLAGALPGLAVGTLLVWPILPSSPVSDPPEPASRRSVTESAPAPSVQAPPCAELEHEVIEIDTLEDLTSYYRVPQRELLEANRDAFTSSLRLIPGAKLKLCSMMPPLVREEIVHTVGRGESLRSIALLYRTTEASILEQLPDGTFEAGEELVLWVPRRERDYKQSSPAPLEPPPDASSQGTPQDGTILNPVMIRGNQDYSVRCPANAYASSHTIQKLDAAIRTLKRSYGYRGQIMVADLSRSEGGQYGRHVSHQSGRDVDIWLPIRGGVYRDSCPARCGSTWCRPEPEDVDWRATWLLIRALIEGGAIDKIFIDQTLMPLLREGARQEGADGEVIARTIRPRRATVMHSPAHKHHIHVRFRCAPGEEGCKERGR